MDVFKLLGAGARFDRKRFKDDLGVFQKRAPGASASSSTIASESVADELDFFKINEKVDEGTSAPSAAAKKRKADDGDGDDEHSFETKHDDSATHADDDEQDEQDEQSSSKKHKPDVSQLVTKEEVNAFRKEHKIKVYGSDVPTPFRTFKELSVRFKFRRYLQQNLEDGQYNAPTPIQMQAIPIMCHGREVMACAPTGSGKTLAFILPILHDLKGPAKEGFRAVIVSPTRELAQQIYREMKKLAKGKPFKICVLSKATNATNDSIAAQLQNFDVLISTPMRLVNAIQSNSINLSKVQHLVLDEADKLLDLGFLEQVDEVFAACTSPNLKKHLFSATIPSGIEALAKTVMHDPIRIVIGQKNAATEIINQQLLYVGQEEGKLIAIRQLVQKGIKPPVLIFVQSIDRARELFHELVYDGINIDVIHSERTKAQRDTIVQNFRLGKIWVLIATELMARGIDFKGVNLVINYDFPQTVQSYIHRIGRTGRAGRPGEAVTYFTKEDAPYLKSIVNVMRESGCEVPEWMLKLKNPSKNAKKELKKKPIERDQIKTVTKRDERQANKKREMVEASKRRKKAPREPKAPSE
ncbi:P-loop containing nucleoside triphosphate hydrolase protein [Polychytrium aggregatum]|uniref:P-loop containing nucleoside triphosphate hydrolase protein n=1 Tax=Polychytrium aggregatum TaxID=110093 RepID=UPI0022FE6918|nr:P-loop containing nucleoside triphosphate hydrolase protein [Polychytrium aggregatum]KAI9208868.1 P-loop containing nucleoside triphosphate hydrolase protein [Polychytrium aggregatum]